MQRFVAYVIGFVAMFAFAVLAPILSLSGAVIWPVHSATDELGKQRAEKSKATREEQAAKLSSVSTDPATKAVQVPVPVAVSMIIPQLQKKTVVKTAALVPGSEAALKAAQTPAAPATPAAAPGVKPAAPGVKPAGPAPQPAAPAPQPAVPAPQPAAPAVQPAPQPVAPAAPALQPSAPAAPPVVKPAPAPSAPVNTPKP